MTDSPLRGWHHGTVLSADTPLALGFQVGEPCLVGREAWDTIVLNDTQIRHITSTQRDVAVRVGDPCLPKVALGRYRSLRAQMLASKNGLLVPFYTPIEKPLPAGFPTHYPANHPDAFQIHMADKSPFVREGRWEADWSLTIVNGKIKGHIWWQDKWLPRVLKDGNWALAQDTHQHEFHEAMESVTITYMMYEDAKIEQIPGLVIQVQGWAHKITLEVVDGYTDTNGGEAKYNADDDAMGKRLGYPSRE